MGIVGGGRWCGGGGGVGGGGGGVACALLPFPLHLPEHTPPSPVPQNFPVLRLVASEFLLAPLP